MRPKSQHSQTFGPNQHWHSHARRPKSQNIVMQLASGLAPRRQRTCIGGHRIRSAMVAKFGGGVRGERAPYRGDHRNYRRLPMESAVTITPKWNM